MPSSLNCGKVDVCQFHVLTVKCSWSFHYNTVSRALKECTWTYCFGSGVEIRKCFWSRSICQTRFQFKTSEDPSIIRWRNTPPPPISQQDNSTRTPSLLLAIPTTITYFKTPPSYSTWLFYPSLICNVKLPPSPILGSKRKTVRSLWKLFRYYGSIMRP